MKICIAGGGNIGTAMAVEFARKNHEVTVLTSKPALWSREIVAVTEDDEELFAAKINSATDDIAKAFDSADYVFVTLPSNVQRGFAESVSPFVTDKMNFVVIPGFGGAEFLMRPVIDKGARLFGLQRTPYVARLKKYGSRIWFDKKKSVKIAAFAEKNFLPIVQDMENLFGMPFETLENYLAVTLTPSNPVLHTSRLFTMFKNFDCENPPAQNILFYATWDDAASEILFKLDDEVQKICRELDDFDLSAVVSLKVHYESDTVPALTKKLRGIKSLNKILAPMKKTSRGYIPDFENRYFLCDFGYGLDILQQFAKVLKIDAPTMKKVMAWYNERAGITKHFLDIADYGLTSKEKICRFYENK